MKTAKSIFTLALLTLMGVTSAKAQQLSKKLNAYAKEVALELNQVSEERQKTLNEIGDYLVTELRDEKKAQIMVICTHNSRRSHIAQAWIQTAMTYYGVDGVVAYSGGLEATAFHPNAIASLERAGFYISGGNTRNPNPVYTVSNGSSSYLHQSKAYGDKLNPKSNFGAIMVCSDADESCPLVQGAEKRFSLPYDDPRYYDDTPSQDQKYDETVREIAREMFYLSDYVKNKLIVALEVKK